MDAAGIKRIDKSGTYEWPWATNHGLIVICGASGGGGGGGGAFCKDKLNIFGSAGGKGGVGGNGTKVVVGPRQYIAFGGDGGGGGGGGGMDEGMPKRGVNGRGARYGEGGDGGQGAKADLEPPKLISEGGDGGKGFPGEIQVIELDDLSKGVSIEVEIGEYGEGGLGGEGYRDAESGADGKGGSVLLVPILQSVEEDS